MIEETENGSLSRNNKEHILLIMSAISKIIDAISEPADPKVLAQLEISYDILEQQLEMDIYFEWPNELKENAIPTEEDLKGWFKNYD